MFPCPLAKVSLYASIAVIPLDEALLQMGGRLKHSEAFLLQVRPDRDAKPSLAGLADESYPPRSPVVTGSPMYGVAQTRRPKPGKNSVLAAL